MSVKVFHIFEKFENKKIYLGYKNLFTGLPPLFFIYKYIIINYLIIKNMVKDFYQW